MLQGWRGGARNHIHQKVLEFFPCLTVINPRNFLFLPCLLCAGYNLCPARGSAVWAGGGGGCMNRPSRVCFFRLISRASFILFDFAATAEVYGRNNEGFKRDPALLVFNRKL